MINYTLLMKPGIIMGNLFTVAAGFFLASKGSFHSLLFFMTFLGIATIIASACIYNNYIDRDIDKKMDRTKNRGFAKGSISTPVALVLAALLLIIGNAALYFFVNELSLLITDFGFCIYVLLYSIWKKHTIYGTAIGSISGAIPPVVGYTAVSNTIDSGALILFVLLVLWQMPHFFSIAIFRLKDYANAGIPVLPVVKGLLKTKIHMFFYILLFVFAQASLHYFHYTGALTLIVCTTLSILWLLLSIQGFNQKNDPKWAKAMFRLSLIIIMAFSLIVPFDSQL